MPERLDLPDQKALSIFDVFKGQKTLRMIDHTESNNCLVVFVLANMTNHFQPPDLAINWKAKQFLKEKFEVWYSNQVMKKLDAGEDVYAIDINTNLSVMKPIHA